MTLISPRLRLAVAMAGVSIACATAVAAQTRKPAPPGPVKAIQPKAPLPDLKINLTAAESLCTVNGTANVELIVRVINAGKGIADFSKAPFQAVVKVKSWWIIEPDGTAKPASASVVLPQVGASVVLGPGQEWTTTLTVLGLPKLKNGPKTPNKYGFEIYADPNSGIAESDESNNTGGVGEADPCFKK